MKNFKVYRASAGSGKTFTLVKDYLKLLFTHESSSYYKHILAVTFTRKATHEMKERIINTLKEIAENPHKNKMASVIMKETGLTGDVLQEKSQNILTDILHHYPDFSISTIDTFFNKIARSFAFDLNIPVNYEIEIKEDVLTEFAIDNLLMRIGDDENITEAFKNRALQQFSEGKKNLRNELVEFSRILKKEEAIRHLSKLTDLSIEDFQKIVRNHNQSLENIQKKLMEYVHQYNKIFDAINEEVESIVKDVKNLGTVNNFFNKVKEGELNPDKLLNNTLLKIHNGESKLSIKERAKTTFSEEDINEITKILNKAVNLIQEQEDILYFLLLTKKHLFGLSMSNELYKELLFQKEETNTIFISDIPWKINKIITSEPVPFIYERVGEKYHHFLIDEFQDTSILQWENFIPLIENSLAEGKENIIVGDGKQAIYRFRNGDVEQFMNLPEFTNLTKSQSTLAEKEKIFKDNYIYPQDALTTNYRSGKAIVDFNNQLFSSIREEIDNSISPLYEGLEQKCASDYEGYVHIEIVSSEEDENYIPEKIVTLIENLSSEKNYKRSEIAILAARNKELVALAEYLLKNNIDVVSSESLLLNNSQEVNLLTALLHLLLNDSYHQKKLTLIKHLAPIDSVQSTFIQLKDKSLQEILNYFQISVSVEQLKKMPLYEQVYQAMKILNISPSNHFIIRFLDVIHEYSSSQTTALSDFLNYWEENKDSLSIKLLQNDNAVHLLSIHKSKGLSFPVVIIPNASWSLSSNNASRPLWVESQGKGELPVYLVNNNNSLSQYVPWAEYKKREDTKTLLDNINLLYVAFTRPEEQLYVFVPQGKRNQKTIYSVYKNILPKLGLSETETPVLTYKKGSPERKKVEKKDAPSGESRKIKVVIPEQHWKEKIKINYEYQKIWQQSNESISYGNKIHRILSLIKHQNQIPAALQSAKLYGWITENEVSEITSLIESIVSHTELKDYFSEDVYVKNEHSIILENGKIIRPDRIIFNNNTLTLIDYKTGQELPEHQQQMESYISALQQGGYRVEKGILVYLSPVKITVIDG